MIATIGLQNAVFRAPVGITESERRKGCQIRVDISMRTDISEASQHDDITKTTDYVRFYEIAAKHLQKETRLLETLLHRIVHDIQNTYPNAESLSVRISKLSPDINGQVEATYVEYSST